MSPRKHRPRLRKTHGLGSLQALGRSAVEGPRLVGWGRRRQGQHSQALGGPAWIPSGCPRRCRMSGRQARLQPRRRESLHAPALRQAGGQHGLQPRGLGGSVQSEVGGGHRSLQHKGAAVTLFRPPTRPGPRRAWATGGLPSGPRSTGSQTSGCCSDCRVHPPP